MLGVLAVIGVWEALILVAIIVFLFGSRKVASAGKSLGRGAREFKKSIRDEERPVERAALPPAREEEEERKPV